MNNVRFAPIEGDEEISEEASVNFGVSRYLLTFIIY